MLVFVHGVPETAAIFDDVRARLDEPSVAVALPGFGCARPDGFDATKDAYVAFLCDELERLGRDGTPLDLVGHDWGALLVLRIVTAHQGPWRSYVVDAAVGLHPSARWHALATTWQTPQEGEAFFERQLAAPRDQVAAAFEALRVPPEGAARLASWCDATMAACILDLYRSAVPNLAAHWGPIGEVAAPGLLLEPSEDPFAGAPEALRAEVAVTLGAQRAPVEGVGHFWPLEAPERMAAILAEFVDSVR